MNDEEQKAHRARKDAKLAALAKTNIQMVQENVGQNPETVERKIKIEDHVDLEALPKAPPAFPNAPPATNATGSGGSPTLPPPPTQPKPGALTYTIPSIGLVVRPQEYHTTVYKGCFRSFLQISVESDDETNNGEGTASKKAKVAAKVKVAEVDTGENGGAAAGSKKTVEKKMRGCDLFKSVCYRIWTTAADTETKIAACSLLWKNITDSPVWNAFFKKVVKDFNDKNPGITDAKIWTTLQNPLITDLAGNANVQKFVGICVFKYTEETDTTSGEWNAEIPENTKRGFPPTDGEDGKVVPK